MTSRNWQRSASASTDLAGKTADNQVVILDVEDEYPVADDEIFGAAGGPEFAAEPDDVGQRAARVVEVRGDDAVRAGE